MGTRVDLDALPPDVREAFEELMAGHEVLLVRAGTTLGSLEFSAHALEGTIVVPPVEAAHRPTAEEESLPEGVTVVATAMKLSESAQARLAEEFGSDYVVLDMHDAPASTDVLLTHPVSPQLLGILKQTFPVARIVITEIEDAELGVHYTGPVSRMLDAGATAYLPPRPVAQIAANVHTLLTHGDELMLEKRQPKALE